MDKSVYRPVQSQPANIQQLRSAVTNRQGGTPFSLHLQTAIGAANSLTISKHAKERLQQRGIYINENCWKQIETKIQEAKKMGVKDSLVLLENAALIVSAKHNTVITAMDRQEASSQIFTNINGTIILK